MKKIVSAIILLMLTACGNDSQNAAEQLNIFNITSLEAHQIQDSTSLLGLWESDEYQDNGSTMQIRWQVQTDKTTLAKKCISQSGVTYYAQVSTNVTTKITHQNNVTTSSIQLNSTDKRTDIVEMTDGEVCRVSINPNSGANQYIIEGDGQEYSIASSEIKNGIIPLNYQEEARSGALTKIGN